MFRSIRRSDWGHALILLLLALPYFLNLGTSSVWDANEAFYAETPREMLESGDYLAPRFNYQARPQKPPLTYWLVLASYKILGVSEFALRLPSALAALGVLLSAYGIGRLLFSPGAALLGAAILATTWRFFVVARRLPIDALLLFFVTGAAFFILRAVTRERNSIADWAPAYLMAAFGFLTKGPIAVVIPFGSYLLWALAARRFSIRSMSPLIGSALFAAVVLPWYLLIYRSHGWSYIADFFLRDNLARFAGESFGPARGPFYYFSTYFVDYFPWSVVSLPVILYAVTRRARWLPERGGVILFPWIWCATIFVLFSLSKNKQEYYILPIYPMISLLVAGTLFPWLSKEVAPPEESWVRRTNAALAVIALILLAAAMYLPMLIAALMPALPGWLSIVPSLILSGGTLAIGWQAFRGRLRGSLTGLLIPQFILVLLVSALYLPHAEAYRPVKDLCATIDSLRQDGDEVGYYQVTLPSMVFYLQRPIFEEFDPDEMVERFVSSRRVLCLLLEHDYQYFVGDRDLVLYVVDRRPRLITQLRLLLDEERWAGQELLLVSNRPASDARPGEAP